MAGARPQRPSRTGGGLMSDILANRPANCEGVPRRRRSRRFPLLSLGPTHYEKTFCNDWATAKSCFRQHLLIAIWREDAIIRAYSVSRRVACASRNRGTIDAEHGAKTMRHLGRISLVVAIVALSQVPQVGAQSRAYHNRVTTSARTQVTSSSATVARSTRTANAAAAALGQYSNRASDSAQGLGGGVSRGSSWEQQARPAAANPVVSQSQPHNYYPTMRSGRAYSQPVTLSANRMGMMGGAGTCTMHRGHAITGGGRR
jgi:hypothetical protein